MEKETLYRFFEGSASLEEERRIRRWMEDSAENRQLFLRERKLFDAATLLGSSAGGEAKGAVPSRNRRRAFVGQLQKVAAIALLALLVSYLYDYHRRVAGNALAMQSISVPAGQRVQLLLPDGTKVWLNARTTLRYPVAFNGRERTMELDGEAYFEVARHPKSPFIVHTAKGSVEALGTSFNVEAYATGNQFETTLMKGSVKVRLKEEPPTAGLILTPDRKAVWADGKLSVEEVSDYTIYRWIDGLICFKDESIPAIMKDFEKYYGVRIHVRNKEVYTYYYTGKFRHTDGIDYALRVLQKDVRFKYTRDDENQIIYIE
ncbi:MAG: FecR domain-containing protein [Tannerellaceae bacterium]|nr:FecR domain-containing protein [Tannerellaceae bacterium]